MTERVTISYEGIEVGADVFIIDWCENTVLKGVVQKVLIGYGPWPDNPVFVAKQYHVSFYDPDKDGVVIRELEPYEAFRTPLEAWEYLRKDLAEDVKDHNKNFGKLMADIQRVEETIAKVRGLPHAKI